MFEQVEHERLHITKDARSLLLNAANDAAVVAILVGTIRRLLLNMAFCEEDPTIPNTRLRRMDVRIYNHFLFVPLFTQMCHSICIATEIAMLTLPDFFCVVHARWYGAEYKTLLRIFAHVP